jgi:hypothetical protein
MSDERPEPLKAAEADAKSATGVDIDQDELKSAKEVVVQLVKTAKTLKIYLPNNPVYQKFLKELQTRFDAHLQEYRELRLRVRQYELLQQGQVIYQNPNRLESLAFKLYVDGIREIAFQKGLDIGEITGFLEIIGREYDPDDPDDDMVTLLWERHLSHINYWVTEDFIQETVSLPETPKASTVQEMAQKETATVQRTAMDSEAVLRQYLGVRPEDQSWAQIYTLTLEEVASVRQQMRLEEGVDSISTLMNILTSILRIEKDYTAFSETMDILDGLLDTFTARGDFEHAIQVLKLYHELTNPQQGFSQAYTERLVKSVEKAGEPQRVNRLESILNQTATIDTDQLTTFFLLLGKNAAAPLIDLMSRLTQMKVRRTLCEVLVQLCKDNIEPLLKQLQDPRWFVIRNILYILGKIGDPRSLEKLELLVTHKEPRVRKELLHLLDAMKEAKAKDLLILFLHDPETDIRLQAVRSLANARHEPALEPLLQVVNGKGFLTKDQMEKRELFEASARIGGSDLIPFFQKLMRQGIRAWFNKAVKEEMALCAVAGLRRIGNEAARAVLEEGQRASRKRIREACLRAMNEMKG